MGKNWCCRHCTCPNHWMSCTLGSRSENSLQHREQDSSDVRALLLERRNVSSCHPRSGGCRNSKKHRLCRQDSTNIPRASCFSLNQPLKSAVDQHNGILKKAVTYEHVDFFMYNTSMVSFDGGSASKVDDVTALPSHIQDGGHALLWQRYDNNKMAAICYSTSSTVQS